MKEALVNVPLERVEKAILSMRGERIILDSDLAELYGVENRALIQAGKRNANRFPKDFVFQLTKVEFDSLRSQTVISKSRGGRRTLPYAFTEHKLEQGRNDRLRASCPRAENLYASPPRGEMSIAVDAQPHVWPFGAELNLAGTHLVSFRPERRRTSTVFRSINISLLWSKGA